MGRTRSTGGSPAKKTGKTPARHTTPRKKSKTPSRKGKSPAKRGRSRSVSKSRFSPQKSTRKSPARKSPGRKSLSKSPSVKSSTPKRGRRSRSNSQSSKVSTRRTPSITQKVKDAAQVLEHKISSPIQSFASNLRSRRAAHDQALNRLGGPYATSSSSRRQPIGQSLIQRVRNSRVANYFSGVRRRFRWPAVKRHVKKNWVRYLVLLATAAGAYYSYQNKKYLEKVINEQYNKLADLVQQQKGSTFSKYFSGWFDESTTTQTPPTIPPRTVDQQQVPQPPHHSTQTTGK